MGTTGLDALGELRAQDVANGIDPKAFRRVPDPPMPAPAPPLQIPAPDWREEEANALERERAAQRAREARGPVREPDPPLHVEDEQVIPAKSTPRLNRVRAWMRADRGDTA